MGAPSTTEPRPEGRYVEVSPGSVSVRTGPLGAHALAPGEARIEVLACGICGTDVHLWHGMTLPPRAAYPVRPGHEVCGRVVELADPPDGPDAVRLGDLVVLHPVKPCGGCANCALGLDHLCSRGALLGIHEPGGLADELVWPADRAVAVNGLDPVRAAVLPDAVATAYRAVRVAEVAPDATVCVLGAGGVGTHVLELLHSLAPGTTLVGVTGTEGSAERLRAAGFTAEVAGDDLVKRLRAAHGTFDTVIEFSGRPEAPAQALRLLRAGGTLVFGSVLEGPLSLGPAVAVQTRELVVRGVFSSSLADLRAVVELARSGRLDLSGSVSHTADLADAAEAFELLAGRPAGLVRMVLTTGRAGG
jgi:propanol-preferring alcohol dehydrogenase